MKTLLVILFFIVWSSSFGQQVSTSHFQIDNQWQNLLDKTLSHWELFVGVPHTTVVLEGYPKSEDVRTGIPLGLHNDPKKVMSVIQNKGVLLLKITGEIYAGLTTLQEFGNYHLKLQFKWGVKKWEPRLDAKRDSGILYHCQGVHGAFWNVWMPSLECQIQEGDMGDFVALVNTRADILSSKVTDRLYQITGKNDTPITYGGGHGNPGYCHIKTSNEKPHGQWNTIEVLCIDNQSIHVVNGKVVMELKNTRKVVDDEEIPLTRGKIQLQSEGAEAYYKNIQIKTIDEFPKKYKRQIGL